MIITFINAMNVSEVLSAVELVEKGCRSNRKALSRDLKIVRVGISRTILLYTRCTYTVICATRQ